MSTIAVLTDAAVVLLGLSGLLFGLARFQDRRDAKDATRPWALASTTGAKMAGADVVLRVRDVCPRPGGAGPDEGPGAGEEFLRDHLAPAYVRADQSSARLIVDLDGVTGFSHAWLRASFGGLAREFGPKTVAARLWIVCSGGPHLVPDIAQIIRRTVHHPMRPLRPH